MKRTPIAAITAFLAALFLIGAAAGPALAHDSLKSSDPAKGSTVKTVEKVKLEFTARVRMPFVIVRGTDGVQHQAGSAETDGPVVRQALKETLPDGEYTIAYRVVSSDGHPIEGEIPFTVKGAPKPETRSPATETPAAQTSETAAAQPAATQSQAPAAPASSAPAAAATQQAGASSAGFPVWLVVVVGALVGIGVGFLISMRKKRP
ncbi:copper resistance CopC family protein [Nonomuraea rhodomycinica]|uniref:Copper resistance protein CopC n=1 Tax=Nonomuraea rhodomycinica TaxID=1712872 RepID=A0A7Y6M9E8_9ACTN|nr:copper resistance CopC family protein [Nonomuraea rhodomycinica]NUW40128.1 copper resistance protein CopC [Nonomuraea rhodomycinica]